jgi:hypothetical protein
MRVKPNTARRRAATCDAGASALGAEPVGVCGGVQQACRTRGKNFYELLAHWRLQALNVSYYTEIVLGCPVGGMLQGEEESVAG